MISPGDIGRSWTVILFEQPTIANRALDMASAAVPYAQLADIVEVVTGRAVRRELLTDARLVFDLAVTPADGMATYRIAFARGDGMWWDKARTYNVARGIPTVDVGACYACIAPERN